MCFPGGAAAVQEVRSVVQEINSDRVITLSVLRCKFRVIYLRAIAKNECTLNTIATES